MPILFGGRSGQNINIYFDSCIQRMTTEISKHLKEGRSEAEIKQMVVKNIY